MSPSRSSAWTLIECLIVLALIGLLLPLGYRQALPYFQQRRCEHEAVAVAAFLTQARTYALVHQQQISVCGGDNPQSCGTHWHMLLMRHAENTLTVYQPSPGVKIRYQGFPSSTQLFFLPDGTAGSNGHFTIERSGAKSCIFVSDSGETRCTNDC